MSVSCTSRAAQAFGLAGDPDLFVVYRSLCGISVEERHGLAAVVIAEDRLQIDVFGRAEDVVRDLRIAAAEVADQCLDLVAFGAALPAAVRHGAGTTQKMQIVIPHPREDVPLPHEVQRADQLHAGEIAAAQFGYHGAHLRPVEHTHQVRFDRVVEMMSQRDLVAAELLCEFVQIPAAHPCA